MDWTRHVTLARMSEPAWVVTAAKFFAALVTIAVILAAGVMLPCSLCVTLPLGIAALVNLNHRARSGYRTQLDRLTKTDKTVIAVGAGVVLVVTLVFFIWVVIAAARS
jgi:hypothetical protein